MEKYRAIPKGYMTVGELAKKMGTTVRTLQYYHKENLLVPSSESDGGRRLYTYKDTIKLHQIMSLKSLGFSLKDIRSSLKSLDTPEDVANVLDGQADDVRRKMEILSESLREIEILKNEVLQIHSVDFKKYADIIVNLQMKNEFYWLIKHFDDKTLEHIRCRFDRDSGIAFIKKFTCLNNEIIELQNKGIAPDSEAGQNVVEKFWKMVVDFTDGDMTMLPKLIEIGSFDGVGNEFAKKQAIVNKYIEQALEIYFTKKGINPIEDGVE